MYLFEGLQESISNFLPPEQIKLVKDAYLIAKSAHDGQFRSSGEPYITHPLAVALILSEMHLDCETIMAAILHDTIEDTEVTHDFLAEKFGATVAELVEGVSKLDKIKFRDKKEAEAENFRKMVLAMTQDVRVILIKLADRTHNMRTLGSLRHEKRLRIARETLEIFAPIANRLGIHSMKSELEDLSLQIMHPARYQLIKKALDAGRGHQKDVLNGLEGTIANRLLDMNIDGKILGRVKNIYSVYNKIKKKKIKFRDVLDLYAFRIIVKDIDTCYRSLGAMHSIYKPRPNRFKDYIAIPKTNGYQSLHTSLVGPRGVPVEIQIRTEEMDQMADKGIAAHWLYKDDDATSSTTQIRTNKWMQSLLELQQNAGSSFEFVENVKTELFPEEIYVFTPNGKILVLPSGSTPVDFAYEVHTDIGDTCVGAKVNRQAYPISAPLTSGQTVEIVTAKNAKPNAAWLNFVVTSKARANIRHFLKNLQQSEAINLGRRLVNHALGDDLTIEQINPSIIKKVLNDTKYPTLDAMLANIGLGNAMSFVIAQRLLGNITTKKEGSMPIRGSEGMLITFANCCKPIPGDPIVAHVSQGKGLVIHMDNCANIKQYQGDTSKCILAQWDLNDDSEYQANLKIEMDNRQGMLAKVTLAISEEGSNIQSLTTTESDGIIHLVQMRITVKNRIHLAKVMRKLRIIPEVLKVTRN